MRKKVLIVDNDEKTIIHVKNNLELAGYSIKSADNAKLALSILSKERFDLVITEIIMPDMDGVELIIKINRKFKNIKTIVMTGYHRLRLNYFEIAMGLGACGTIRKPFSSIDLINEANRVLNIVN